MMRGFGVVAIQQREEMETSFKDKLSLILEHTQCQVRSENTLYTLLDHPFYDLDSPFIPHALVFANPQFPGMKDRRKACFFFSLNVKHHLPG